jgi:hypothetical protein
MSAKQIQGLTSKDIKLMLDCFIKANNQQLESLRWELNAEIRKREYNNNSAIRMY